MVWQTLQGSHWFKLGVTSQMMLTCIACKQYTAGMPSTYKEQRELQWNLDGKSVAGFLLDLQLLLDLSWLPRNLQLVCK